MLRLSLTGNKLVQITIIDITLPAYSHSLAQKYVCASIGFHGIQLSQQMYTVLYHNDFKYLQILRRLVATSIVRPRHLRDSMHKTFSLTVANLSTYDSKTKAVPYSHVRGCEPKCSYF